MNKSAIRKKMVYFALKNSSVCRKKYFDMFYRKSRVNAKIYYTRENALDLVLNHAKIVDVYSGVFFNTLDESFCRFYAKNVIGNMPPDYSLIINNSIEYLLENNSGKSNVEKSNYATISAVKTFILRIIDILSNADSSDIRISYFKNMLTQKAETLEDALQRVLLWSSVFWQTGHSLVGLGRLDVLLGDIDIERSSDETIPVFMEFVKELHKYYGYKSASLLGDIGQIIILGGATADGGYFCNRYTYDILEAVKRCCVTDPKILLRVSSKIPDGLLNNAVDCLSGGSGSPLFSNDDVVIPCLLDFGYDKEDAYNYITSACWEPLSYGNSLEQNNIEDVKFADAFVKTMQDSEVVKCHDYKTFLNLYKKHLKNEIQWVLDEISAYEWEPDPLFTLFTRGCKEKDLDISEGGAKYNNYGILSIGMANAVNSILNIREDVFKNKNVQIADLYSVWKENTDSGNQKVVGRCKSKEKRFGHDEDDYIELTNNLLNFTMECISKYRNKFGGKVKIGLSSPGYIAKSKNVGLTYDGRKANAPCSVHISCDDGIAYTELVSFASQLDYCGNTSNGNVIDFFVAPDFIKNNKEKFADFIKLSIKQGFFQMQMNVVGSDTLIEAKKHPENFKNLIVRVWGFSAYFVELPEEYQDLLIERALKSEGK